jgi:hypothetical protein
MPVPAGGSAGAALVASLAPPPPLGLPPPLPQDRVTGRAAPPPPRQRRRPGRSLILLKIGLSAVIPVVAFGARVALRQSTAEEPELRRATSASDFSGRCVIRTGSRLETVSCDDPHTGRVLDIVDVSGTCPADTIESMVASTDPTKQICITPG